MAEIKQVRLHGEKELPNDRTEYFVEFLADEDEVVSLGNEVSDLVLTGYEIGTAGAVEATDTVLEAIAKLEARIVELEAP